MNQIERIESKLSEVLAALATIKAEQAKAQTMTLSVDGMTYTFSISAVQVNETLPMKPDLPTYNPYSGIIFKDPTDKDEAIRTAMEEAWEDLFNSPKPKTEAKPVDPDAAPVRKEGPKGWTKKLKVRETIQNLIKADRGRQMTFKQLGEKYNLSPSTCQLIVYGVYNKRARTLKDARAKGLIK